MMTRAEVEASRRGYTVEQSRTMTLRWNFLDSGERNPKNFKTEQEAWEGACKHCGTVDLSNKADRVMSTKPKKIPKRVQAVVAKCKAGEKLCKFLRQKETGETDVCFIFEPSGKRCGPRSARDAIARGLLLPAGDGLFEDEFSQTWIAA